MGILLQAFEHGIDHVHYWTVNKRGYRTTESFAPQRFGVNYDRELYFKNRLTKLEGGNALMIGEYRQKFLDKILNKENNPRF